MEPEPKRVLLAGESWVMHTIHQKGFDHFTTTAYGEGHQWLSGALAAGGCVVEHPRCRTGWRCCATTSPAAAGW